MHTMGCDMHWVYRLYAFMCSAHLAFCVLELSLGYAPAAPTLSLKEDTCAPNSTTLLLLHPAPLPLSGLYFLACMASTAFSQTERPSNQRCMNAIVIQSCPHFKSKRPPNPATPSKSCSCKNCETSASGWTPALG